MRLAILADIHGNLQALDAVLADVEDAGADRVVVNGDMVNRGPNNLAVMERLTDARLTMTLGNHDDLMRKWVEHDPDLPPAWFDDPYWQGTAWCAEQLDHAGWIDTFRDLPMTAHPAPETAPSVLVSHGSPRHYREGYGRHLSDETLSEILEMHPAEVLVGSHTHRPLERRWSRYLILNTGAVGAPFNGDPRAQYLLLTLENGRWTPEFRQVPYDRNAALAAFHETGYLDEGGLSAHIFYAELEHARSFFVPFWMWSEEQELGKDEESWALFREAFPQRFTRVE